MKRYLDFEEICHLEKELYDLWKATEKHNYGIAKNKAATCWMFVHNARLNAPPIDNRATTDSDLRAVVTKALYALFNAIGLRRIRRCHKEGFWCEWEYPYGFVPEGGCPYHD